MSNDELISLASLVTLRNPNEASSQTFIQINLADQQDIENREPLVMKTPFTGYRVLFSHPESRMQNLKEYYRSLVTINTYRLQILF